MVSTRLWLLLALAWTGRAIKLRARNTTSGDHHEHGDHHEDNRKNCPLPQGAKWCAVNAGGISFFMAVYFGNDIVSNSICSSGHWEGPDIQGLGTPGVAMDIGANIGYITFLLAKAGWSVVAFEPLTANLDLMRATMCANPDLQTRVNLLAFGLGPQSTTCQFVSGNDNLGDGVTRCGPNASAPLPPNMAVRGTFQIRRLDEVLAEQHIARIDFLKLDVEGYECQVFAGAPNLLSTYKPRLVHTEAWATMQDCTPQQYINSYTQAGYTVANDQYCYTVDTSPPSAAVPIKNYWMCKNAAMFLAGQPPKPHQKRYILFKLD